MSSSSSVRRLKDRGGGAGSNGGPKPTPPLKSSSSSSKTLTPISEKETEKSSKKPTGKENPRSVSATRNPGLCQKPTVRPLPIPRIDKPASQVKDGGESKVRWSTSSIPRGRSSSPSDFAKFLSDFRKDRMPRVSVTDRKTLERENGGGVDVVGLSKGRELSGSRGFERSQQKKGNLGLNVREHERIEKGLRGVGESTSKGRFSDSVGSERKGRFSDGVGSEKKTIIVLDDRKVSHLSVKPAEKNLDVAKRLSNYKGEVNLNSNLERAGSKNEIIEGCKDKGYLELNVKVTNKDVSSSVKVIDDCKEKGVLVSVSEGKVEELGNSSRGSERSRNVGVLGSNSKGLVSKASIGLKNLETSKEKGTGEEDKGVRVTTKYPSKLHEKLAFLEGKVKRIASDIKKTKEMLDTNNPDGSKTIISDIQDKISGIEKDMVHVINDNNPSLALAKTVENDDLPSKSLGSSENKQVGHLKNSIKRLNHEELEARLFPHNKLLRSRASLSTSSESSQIDRPHLAEVRDDSKPEEVPLSPIDDNAIALEFLASLHKEQPKESMRDEYVGVEFYEVHEMDVAETSAAQDNSNMATDGNREGDVTLTTDEIIEDFDNQENKPTMPVLDEIEDLRVDQLHEIGRKASTGGWFVSEGESVLLAHEDGSCSFYDITNSEEKAEYKPPAGLSPNLWGDCWLIRAAGSDGCSGRYVVAASSGNALESGFCSWDFYTKDVRAFHVEDATITSSRTVLGPLPNIGLYRRNASSTVMVPENRQWWYKPCGPLLVSTASSQKVVKVFDIRDGEEVMKWEVQRPVTVMDYSSPLQWRNRGRVVVAETESVSLWDVNSLTPQALVSVPSNGRRISALHVNNTDAELGGGVRRRVSSSEVEGNDGVFCTQESINVLDFRLPSGVGLKISKHGVTVQSIFSRGDSIFLGCTDGRLTTASGKAHSRIQHYSLRKGTLCSTYALPESNAHFHYTAISQVWGNSNFVMGVCGLGLFIFDTLQDEESTSLAVDYLKTQQVKDVIGPNDLYTPSFDYLSSRVLVISRDRPAFWRYLL